MAKAAEEAAGAEAMTAAGAKVGSHIDFMSFLLLVCLRLFSSRHLI